MERDLVALRSAGVPLYAHRGRSGGQRSIDRPGQVVLSLSTSEVSALLIALAAAGADMPFLDDGLSAANRLLDGLPAGARVAVDGLRARIRTAVGDDVSAVPRIRRTVEEAVRRSVVVNIDYVDRDGPATSRSVEAAGFYQGGDGWYLIGWCLLRDGGRIFRLDRVRSARMTRRRIVDRPVDEVLGWVPHSLAVP